MKKIPLWMLAAAAYFFLSKKSDAGTGPSSSWSTLKNPAGQPATAAVTKGSPVVAFSSLQALSKGQSLVFDGAQPGVTYTLAKDATGLTATLDRPYNGTTNAASRVSIKQ